MSPRIWAGWVDGCPLKPRSTGARRLYYWTLRLYAGYCRSEAARHEERAVVELEDAAECSERADRIERRMRRMRRQRQEALTLRKEVIG